MWFVAWYALERDDAAQRPSVAKSTADKAAAIEDAQRRGVVTGDRAAAWSRRAKRRRVVVDTVKQLVTP